MHSRVKKKDTRILQPDGRSGDDLSVRRRC